MYDVTALGELLIDFTPSGISESGMNTAFIGKVGCDIHGDFLRETLEK